MARLAYSLVDLRAEFDLRFPGRSKLSDGWIGDAAHRRSPSRHNPNNAGVVCALDITHDPANGLDVHAIARQIINNPHPDLEYVISNTQISSRSNSWGWRTYSGSNPHVRHAHFAVGMGPDSEPRQPYDTRHIWGVYDISAVVITVPEVDNMASAPPPTIRRGDSGQWVRNMQALLIAHGNSLSVDGDYGPQTERVLADWQARTGGLASDGVCGPRTWQWLTGIQVQGGG